MEATNPELARRAMRIRNWLPYYRWPYDGQQEFYAALCSAADFQALPDRYRRAILDAEAALDRACVHGPTRFAYWIGLGIVGPLFVVVVAYAILMLASAAFAPIPADAVEPPDDFVPLGFIVGVLVAGGLGKVWKLLYYGLWPERER